MAFKIGQIDTKKKVVMMVHQSDFPAFYVPQDFVGFDLSRCSSIAFQIRAVINGNKQGEVIAPGWIENAIGKLFRREPVVRRVLLSTTTTRNPASILRITSAEKKGESWLYLFWHDPFITDQYSFPISKEELEQLAELLDEVAEGSMK